MSGNDSTPPIDERLGRLSEELRAMLDAGEVIDVDELAACFELSASDVDDCVRAVEAFGFCVGEDAPASLTQHEIPKPTLPDDYALGEELGRGGMGIVYRAHQESLNRDVAIKVLRPGDLVFGDALARFRSEARSLARLRHRHIVSVHEVGESQEGFLYFTMDLVEGQTLASTINKTTGKCGTTPTRAVKWLRQVASAITHAHGQGIIHRDLKPQNILIDTDGDAFVVDFGLARDAGAISSHTITGQLLGTPAYMSPEQAKGDSDQIGETTDIWALGAILYECLTGRSPFAGKPLHETIHSILHDEPVRPRKLDPRVPLDLETICLKALSKQPQDRYTSALAFAEDLERFSEGREVRAQPISSTRRLGMSIARNRASLISATIGAALVVMSFYTCVIPYIEHQQVLTRSELALARGKPEEALGLLETYGSKHFGSRFDAHMLCYARALNDRAEEIKEEEPGKSKSLAKRAEECNPIPQHSAIIGAPQSITNRPGWLIEHLRAQSIQGRLHPMGVWGFPDDTIDILVGLHDEAHPEERRLSFELIWRLFAPYDDSLVSKWLIEHKDRIPELLPKILIAQYEHQQDHGLHTDLICTLWTPELESELARLIEHDSDLPDGPRAYLLECLIKFTGLPGGLRTSMFVRPGSDESKIRYPTPAEFCALIPEVLRDWRRALGLSREETLKLRIEQCLERWRNEQASPRLWSPSSEHLRNLTGEHLRTLTLAEAWWAKRRSLSPHQWLAERLGCSAQATLEERFELFMEDMRKSAAMEFFRLAIPESTPTPMGFPWMWGERSARISFWRDLAGLKPRPKYRLRVGLLMFLDGSPSPRLIGQSSTRFSMDQELELDTAITPFESFSMSTRQGSLGRAARATRMQPRAHTTGRAFVYNGELVLKADTKILASLGGRTGWLGTGGSKRIRIGAAGRTCVMQSKSEDSSIDIISVAAIEELSEPDLVWTMKDWSDALSRGLPPYRGTEIYDYLPFPEHLESMRSANNLLVGDGIKARLMSGDTVRLRAELRLAGDQPPRELWKGITTTELTRILLGSSSQEIRDAALDELETRRPDEVPAAVAHTLLTSIEEGALSTSAELERMLRSKPEPSERPDFTGSSRFLGNQILYLSMLFIGLLIFWLPRLPWAWNELALLASAAGTIGLLCHSLMINGIEVLQPTALFTLLTTLSYLFTRKGTGMHRHLLTVFCAFLTIENACVGTGGWIIDGANIAILLLLTIFAIANITTRKRG